MKMKKLILILTHKMWNRRIAAILCNSYEARIINSNQLHKLTAKFDQTQDHEVY